MNSEIRTIRHFVECDCSTLAVGQDLIVNGTTTLSVRHPDDWRSLTSDTKAAWLRQNEDRDFWAYAKDRSGAWRRIGPVTDEAASLAAWDISYGRFYRTSRTDSLVGYPFNIRGVDGFDELCSSHVVAIYVSDPSTGKQGSMVETQIGPRRRRGLLTRLEAGLGAIFGSSR